MYGMVSPDPAIYGDSGMNNPPFYGASKAAVIQLSRYFAGHVIERGIRTNSVSPGPFPPDSIKTTNSEFHAELCKKTPMGRIGQAGEVAAAVHFLLSSDASYINGANLPVDGGWTSW
jgi:NAD(P)-dependent dehydrogenase (short-subunit alcohol dehydrogenase family)